MASPVWITPAGFLGTVTERTSVNVAFTVSGTATTFSVLAGELPSGLVLKAETTTTNGITTCFIVGNPTSVPTTITSQFVIRSKNTSGLADRKFTLDVIGNTDPVWVTPAGYLPLGTSGEYFAVNEQIVDYQLNAIPDVLFENMKMRYYIAENDGQLPNGIRLTEDGRIHGIINEKTVIEDGSFASSAAYDGEKYDKYPYDSAVIVNDESVKPKFIKKIYQFYVTATDGYNSVKKMFKVQVVDHQTLRSDTTYINADASFFQSGISYLLTPVWLSPANLGIRRANNYQIIDLKTYDPIPEFGPVTWSWDDVTVNSEIKVFADTQLGGLEEDGNRYPLYNRAGTSTVHLKNLTSLPSVGQQFRLDSYLPNIGYTTTYTISSVSGTKTSCQLGIQHSPQLVNGSVIYNTTLLDELPDEAIFYIGTAATHPLGFNLNAETGTLYGQIPYIPAYSIDYKFTIRMTKVDPKNGETSKSDRVFSLRLQGSITSDLSWVTTSTVGLIRTGYQSELNIKAEHSDNPDLGVTYKFVSGELPNGLEFKSDGSIIGKIPYGGLTSVDNDSLTIDGGVTTVDRSYTFTAEATNVYRLATIDQEFKIYIGDNGPVPFSSIYVRPFMERSKRRYYRDFINRIDVFDSKVLYRPNDPAFGLQQDIKMIIEYGIERLNLAEYVGGLQYYFYNKRFYFGKVKTLPAEDDRGNYVYDIVYVDIIDTAVSNSGRSPDHLSFLINQNLVDVYQSTVENWQSSLESITVYGETIKVDEYLRPRFMRTIQSDGAPLGFIKAVPICYTKPGQGATIVRKIQLSGFDFKLLDFEVDRLLIDQTFDYASDKYLKFPIKNADSARPVNVLAGPDGVIITDENGIELLIE
jgi:hypothetical protein